MIIPPKYFSQNILRIRYLFEKDSKFLRAAASKKIPQRHVILYQDSLLPFILKYLLFVENGSKGLPPPS